MSFELLHKSVKDRFQTLWSGTDPDRVDFGDNLNFKEPKSGEWVRVVTNVIDGGNAEVGTGFQRSEGIITVQCFAEKNKGEKALFNLIDQVLVIFQNKQFNGVSCFETIPLRVGETKNWYQINAKTTFEYDVFS